MDELRRGPLFGFEGAADADDFCGDVYKARWSSGQDGGLSRPKREFDSPTGHHFDPDDFLRSKPELGKIRTFSSAGRAPDS